MTPSRDARQFDSSLGAADSIRQWLEVRLARAGVDTEAASLMQLAASEIAVNISRHAYHGVPTGVIAAALEVRPGEVCLTLTHQGCAFDRSAWVPPDLTTAHEGGYGIYLVETLMDEVRYQPGQPDGHRVVLVKRLGQRTSAAPQYNAGNEPAP